MTAASALRDSTRKAVAWTGDIMRNIARDMKETTMITGIMAIMTSTDMVIAGTIKPDDQIK